MAEKLFVIGQRYPMVDGLERVTGSAKFAPDIELPGMLHAKVLGSPHAHARIVSIDTSKAEALSGVKAVLTHKDIHPVLYGGPPIDRYILEDRVRLVWDEVAAVAAETTEIADEAIGLIEVEYEVLPAVLDPEESLEPGAPKIHPATHPEGNINGMSPILIEKGDIQAGFTEADLILEGRYETQKWYQGSLESRGCVAMWDESGNLSVWDATQTPFIDRTELAHPLEMPMAKIRVMSYYVGGGFGEKDKEKRHQHIAALLAKKARRPVKLWLTRREQMSGHMRCKHGSIGYFRIGVKNDGTITAIDTRLITDTGAYGTGGTSITSVAGGGPTYLYRCPNTRFEGFTMYTNTGAAGASRGYGDQQGQFGLELLLDEIAEELGINPLEFQLNNHIRTGDPLGPPYFPALSSEDYDGGLTKGAEMIGWAEKWHQPGEKTLANGKKHGMGVAIGIHGSGIPISGAVVKVAFDGSVTLLTGAEDVGQGSKTTLSQICAEALGARMEDVHVVNADTETTPYDTGSIATRTAFTMGLAVQQAAAEAKSKLLQLASQMLEVTPEELEAEEGQIYVKESPEIRVTFRSVAGLYSGWAPGSMVIMGEGSSTGSFFGMSCQSTNACFAEVEVDTDTGLVEVQKIVLAQDCGRAINPMIVEGQMEGGSAQGFCYSLLGDVVYDPDTLAPLNPCFLGYKMPTALDVPELRNIILEPIDPLGAFGVKGIGETCKMNQHVAIANAVYNAIGVRIREIPITPDKVLKALGKV